MPQPSITGQTLSRMEGNDELGAEWRGELDACLLVDVVGDADVGQVELPGLAGVGQRQHAHQSHPAIARII